MSLNRRIILDGRPSKITWTPTVPIWGRNFSSLHRAIEELLQLSNIKGSRRQLLGSVGRICRLNWVQANVLMLIVMNGSLVQKWAKSLILSVHLRECWKCHHLLSCEHIRIGILFEECWRRKGRGWLTHLHFHRACWAEQMLLFEESW